MNPATYGYYKCGSDSDVVYGPTAAWSKCRPGVFVVLAYLNKDIGQNPKAWGKTKNVSKW